MCSAAVRPSGRSPDTASLRGRSRRRTSGGRPGRRGGRSPVCRCPPPRGRSGPCPGSPRSIRRDRSTRAVATQCAVDEAFRPEDDRDVRPRGRCGDGGPGAFEERRVGRRHGLAHAAIAGDEAFREADDVGARCGGSSMARSASAIDSSGDAGNLRLASAIRKVLMPSFCDRSSSRRSLAAARRRVISRCSCPLTFFHPPDPPSPRGARPAIGGVLPERHSHPTFSIGCVDAGSSTLSLEGREDSAPRRRRGADQSGHGALVQSAAGSVLGLPHASFRPGLDRVARRRPRMADPAPQQPRPGRVRRDGGDRCGEWRRPRRRAAAA